ncbi:MAG: TonB C-terminal domain-containing protein [Cyanobacteria bacterium TGS_CYA1]|nr:TonB C-terminal domain-containing protein [Cyanobacteria bacterium TGS_CYA1]
MKIFTIWLLMSFISVSAACFAPVALAQAKPADASVETIEGYKSYLQTRVMRNYFPPKCSSPGPTEVAFSIERNGGVTCVRLKKSSGCPLYDMAALQAVERAVPYRSLPEDRANLNVAVNFDMGKIWKKKSVVSILNAPLAKIDTTPKTKSADLLTQPRTVKNLCQALRDADFARAQMDISGIPQEGKNLLVRILFRQIENMLEAPGMKDSDSITIVLDKTVYLKADSRAKLHEASKPVIEILKARKSNAELKTNQEFLSALANFFEAVDRDAVYE